MIKVKSINDFSVDTEDYDLVLKIRQEADIAVARQMVKDFAKKNGFSLADVTKIATVVSELSRNIQRYAKKGYICARKKHGKDGNVLLEVLAYDNGPGIKDVELAVTGGYTTSQRSLGLGLSGVRRLMDTFKIISEEGKGTIVITEIRRRTF